MGERNALKELEDWCSNQKGRYVSDMGIDTGYGATCWELTLGNVNVKAKKNWYKEGEKTAKLNRAEVYAAETNFMGHNELPPNIVYAVDGDEMDGWPGLEKTILAAIDKANELGL